MDNRRMEHFTCLCAVLFEFITDISLPNSAELMGIYGRVSFFRWTVYIVTLINFVNPRSSLQSFKAITLKIKAQYW